MSFTYGFYNSLNGDRKYNAEQVSAIFDGLITDGVFLTQGEIFATVPGEGLQVVVKTGRAWFKHTWNLNDAWMPINLEQANISFPRIDAVVMEINSETSSRRNKIYILTGEPSSTPVKPQLEDSLNIRQIPLAYVTVPASASALTKSDIQIVVGTSECPFVSGIIQTVNIDDLFLKWEGDFEAWWDNIKATLNDNIVTNLQNQIDKCVKKVEDKATSAQVTAGTDNTKYITPAALKPLADSLALGAQSVLDTTTGEKVSLTSVLDTVGISPISVKIIATQVDFSSVVLTSSTSVTVQYSGVVSNSALMTVGNVKTNYGVDISGSYASPGVEKTYTLLANQHAAANNINPIFAYNPSRNKLFCLCTCACKAASAVLNIVVTGTAPAYVFTPGSVTIAQSTTISNTLAVCSVDTSTPGEKTLSFVADLGAVGSNSGYSGFGGYGVVGDSNIISVANYGKTEWLFDMVNNTCVDISSYAGTRFGQTSYFGAVNTSNTLAYWARSGGTMNTLNLGTSNVTLIGVYSNYIYFIERTSNTVYTLGRISIGTSPSVTRTLATFDSAAKWSGTTQLDMSLFMHDDAYAYLVVTATQSSVAKVCPTTLRIAMSNYSTNWSSLPALNAALAARPYRLTGAVQIAYLGTIGTKAYGVGGGGGETYMWPLLELNKTTGALSWSLTHSYWRDWCGARSASKAEQIVSIPGIQNTVVYTIQAINVVTGITSPMVAFAAVMPAYAGSGYYPTALGYGFGNQNYNISQPELLYPYSWTPLLCGPTINKNTILTMAVSATRYTPTDGASYDVAVFGGGTPSFRPYVQPAVG